MKKWLSILSAALLLLYPFATFAADYGSQASQTQQVPPVAQALVREGDFAIKLAATLDLGNWTDESAAEDILAKAGVTPLNGWISDYPMTPQIVGQLEDSIAAAAAANNVPMSRDEATQRLYALTAELNLASPVGSGATAPSAPADSTYVADYYADAGPPIITYYPPPVDYVYLYDWVPYPVFWFGFWFPGFFICHNFTTTVVVTHTAFVTRTAIVSNRIFNPVTRSVFVVDPVVRTSSGTVLPVTALRTGSGHMFRTTSDIRQGFNMAGVSAVRQETFTKTALGTGGFRSTGARKSAEAIMSRNVQATSPRVIGGISTVHNQGQFARTVVPARPIMHAAPPVMRRGPSTIRPSFSNGWHGRG